MAAMAEPGQGLSNIYISRANPAALDFQLIARNNYGEERPLEVKASMLAERDPFRIPLRAALITNNQYITPLATPVLQCDSRDDPIAQTVCRSAPDDGLCCCTSQGAPKAGETNDCADNYRTTKTIRGDYKILIERDTDGEALMQVLALDDSPVRQVKLASSAALLDDMQTKVAVKAALHAALAAPASNPGGILSNNNGDLKFHVSVASDGSILSSMLDAQGALMLDTQIDADAQAMLSANAYYALLAPQVDEAQFSMLAQQGIQKLKYAKDLQNPNRLALHMLQAGGALLPMVLSMSDEVTASNLQLAAPMSALLAAATTTNTALARSEMLLQGDMLAMQNFQADNTALDELRIQTALLQEPMLAQLLSPMQE